ncbi:MAG: type 1 glutamine amidotransferase [Nitrospira sp.]|nr:type 1 glutamine amidotransferase [Nitrospira sp.]
MAVLILKNISTEGPGTIGNFLKKEDIPFSIVELDSGETPPLLEKFDTLVVMGGPMGIYEMDKYPHIMIASRTIREAINRDMKVLGICLGSQMIAHCLGAEVYPGPEKEIGWYHIELTGEGLKDTLMRKLAIHPRVGDFWRKFKVFHWHGDFFDIPPGVVVLASSKLYKNQAFRYGDTVYGFQFHIEITKDMLLEWFRNSHEMHHVMGETEKIYEEYTGRAMNFYKAFFKRGDKP